MIRESSPPDAIPSSGPNGSPGFGAMRKATRSAPLASGSSGSSATVNRQRSRPRSPRCPPTLLPRPFPPLSRARAGPPPPAVGAARCGGPLADQEAGARRRARAQPLRRSRDTERGREVRVLAGLDVRRLDLFDLVLEEGEPARSFARIAAERGALGDDVAERAMRRRGRATEARVITVRVEEIALHRGAREPQLLALTVDRDEIRAALGGLRELNGLD